MGRFQIMVGKDVEYASTDNSTEENADNPNDLYEGSIGIFSTDDGTRLDSSDDYTDHQKIFFALGLGNDAQGNQLAPEMSQDIHGADITAYKGSSYIAPVRPIGFVGYNGTSGDIATSSGGDYVLKVTDLSLGRVAQEVRESFSYYAASGDSPYTIAAGLITEINRRITRFNDGRRPIIKGDIVSNGTGSAIANSATVAAVNGGTSFTTSAAHGVGVGDWVALEGNLYQAVTGTASTTLVIDRPYEGATGTVDNTNAVDLGATEPTLIGLEITARNNFVNFSIHTDSDEAFGATPITQPWETGGTDFVMGAGTSAEISRKEVKSLGYQGVFTSPKMDSINYTITVPGSLVVNGETYDQYVIGYNAAVAGRGGLKANTGEPSTLVIAVPSGPSTFDQSTFESRLNTWMASVPGAFGSVTL